MRLKDKVAIVTGAAHGMGEAEARLFAKEGAAVVIADVLTKEGEAVAADISASQGRARFVRTDVTAEQDWQRLIAETIATYGRLDILVNNAGISGSAVGDDSSLEGWQKLLTINATSAFLGTKLAAAEMAKAGRGSIVNISSIVGIVGSEFRPSRLSRVQGRGTQSDQGSGAALRTAGGAGELGAPRLHAADAECDQRRRPCREDRRDAVAPAGRADRGRLRRVVPRLR